MMEITFYFFLSLCIYTNCATDNPETFHISLEEYRPYVSIEKTFYDEFYLNVKEAIVNVESYYEADLIVFPEGIFNYLASVRDIPLINYTTYVNIGDNPCINPTKYPKYLIEMSCAANTSEQAVVLNIPEQSKCAKHDNANRNCKKWGHKIYNTNIIFNENGTIVERYRKYNLINETEFDQPDKPEVVTFSIKSGIKFGILNSYDLLFKYPANELLRQVTKIILPNLWPAELPFLTSFQVQQMWAIEHDVQLYSSASHIASLGSYGHGAFNGKNGSWMQNIYSFNDVIKSPDEYTDYDISDYNMDEIELYSSGNFRILQEDLSKYKSKLLNIDVPNSKEYLCHDDFCCNFDIQIQKNYETHTKYYTYHLVVYAGLRKFWNDYEGNIEVCAVVACLNRDLNSCGLRFPENDQISWPIQFQTLEIRANYSDVGEDKIQYPNSLLSSFRSIPASDVIWTANKTNGRIERKFSILKTQSTLMTFAIYGQSFLETNPDQNHFNYEITIYFFTICIILVLLSFVLFFLSARIILIVKVVSKTYFAKKHTQF